MNKKTLLNSAIALVACSYAIAPLGADTNEIILQLTPAGNFLPADGRKLDVPSWRIDAAVATQVIDRFNARNQPVVIDYEHQTLHKEENGQPAPAAAWMRELIWREGDGLYARVELTSAAKKAIAEKEYLYFSPVFSYNKYTGDVTAIEMGALTNTPALHGMSALEVRAAATFNRSTQTEDAPMNKLLLAIIAGLSLAQTATEDEAAAALSAHFAKDPLKPLREVLGTDANADETVLVAACSKLKSTNPDPANYAPVSVMTDLKNQVAVLSEKLNARDAADVSTAIDAALEDGRLLPAQKEWAEGLGKTNVAALTSFLATAQPIAALSASQTQGKPPVVNSETGLTDDELAVCTNMGISPEDFKKNKTA